MWLPARSISPPTISRVSFHNLDETFADTSGSTLLLVEGQHFGPLSEYINASVEVPSGQLALHNCVLQQSDVEVVCTLPAGTGVISTLKVSVLGQLVSFPL
jgi:hypothetical protein